METIASNMEEVTSTTDGPDLLKFPLAGQNNYTDLGNNMEMDSNMVNNISDDISLHTVTDCIMELYN